MSEKYSNSESEQMPETTSTSYELAGTRPVSFRMSEMQLSMLIGIAEVEEERSLGDYAREAVAGLIERKLDDPEFREKVKARLDYLEKSAYLKKNGIRSIDE